MDSQAVSRSTSVQLFRSHDPSFAPIHLRKALSCLRALGKQSACIQRCLKQKNGSQHPKAQRRPKPSRCLDSKSIRLPPKNTAKAIVSEAMARSRSRDRGRLRRLSVGSLASGWAPGLHQKAKPALQTLSLGV